MTKLLHLKHWQLFLLLIGIPIVFQVVAVSSIFINQDPTFMLMIFPVIMVLFMALLFAWLYSIGTGLQRKLPSSVKMNVTRFKIFLAIPAVYILFICLFMAVLFTGQSRVEEDSMTIAALIVPLHLFCMFCIFYCLYFVAKSLKAAEWQRPVTFSDFAGEFFLLWFFPIGVWIIQPRINLLFTDRQQTAVG